MLKDTFLHLGFTPNQAEVYKTLVEIGEAKVGELVSRTGFHWNIVNRALQDLVKRRLVYKTNKKGVAHYASANPQVLLAQYQQKLDLAQEAIDELKNVQTGKPEVLVLTGEQGISDFLELLLQTKEYMNVMGVNYFWSKEYRELYNKFEDRFVKKGIKRLILANPKNKEYIETIREAETRFLPKELSNSPLAISIFDDYVAQIISAKPNLIIVVKNKEIAKGYRDYFKFLWDQAR